MRTLELDAQVTHVGVGAHVTSTPHGDAFTVTQVFARLDGTASAAPHPGERNRRHD